MSHHARPERATNDSGPAGPVKASDDPPEDQRSSSKAARSLPVGFQPLLSIHDLAAILSCSRRLVERMRSAGKIPRPDLKIGKMPRWNPETIRRWIEEGGRT